MRIPVNVPRDPNGFGISKLLDLYEITFTYDPGDVAYYGYMSIGGSCLVMQETISGFGGTYKYCTVADASTLETLFNAAIGGDASGLEALTFVYLNEVYV